MLDKRIRFVFLVLSLGFSQICVQAASRIKDVAAFEGVRDNIIFGYGLVVGLNGTGDRNQTFFSAQSLTNMLDKSGITVDPEKVRVKNIAAVYVTATLPPFVRQGSRLDITASSLGDAQSIQGGVLIMTPLQAVNGQVYATAQGQIALGGYSASSGGNTAQTNHPTVGRIPSGGLVEKEVPMDLSSKSRLTLVLNNNDFTTASRAMRAINESVGSGVANAVDGRTIAIQVPSDYSNRIVEFMAAIENARLDVDISARVVLNEKTGTIVLGRDVKISEVSIIHGSLSLQVGTIYNVSQPQPFAKGETVVVPDTTLSVKEEKGKTATIRDGASVEEVIKALNDIGAGPRDIIAILQAIKAQGALQAELEII